jgi:hypothetical protein
VLAARSPVFREMFENTEEDNRAEVNISLIEPTVLETLIEFIYTNRVGTSLS